MQSRGLKVYHLPCIEIQPTPLSPEIQDALEQFTAYQWAVFTSAAGVKRFAELAVEAGLDRRKLTAAWYAAVGNQTADALKFLGLVVKFTPSESNAATLARELKRVKSRQILLLRTSIAPPEAADILRRRGAHVIDLPIYQTLPVTEPDPGFTQLLREGSVSGLVFASPSAVTGFVQRLSDPVALELARDIPSAAIGPTVAATLSGHDFRAVRTAPRPSLEAALEVLAW
jgi:uroporphyrinogen III methyltransferase/synthase